MSNSGLEMTGQLDSPGLMLKINLNLGVFFFN